MDAQKKRPRSTIVPGRHMFDLHVLHLAGIEDDNSYRDLATDPSNSDATATRRSSTGRDSPARSVRMPLRSFDLNADVSDRIVVEHPVEPEQVEDMLNEQESIIEIEEVTIRPKKRIRTQKARARGMFLAKLPFYEASGRVSPTGRPYRNRCQPVRWWLGEEPIYKWSVSGCGELRGVTDVVVQDREYCKYGTASPVDIIRMKWAAKKRYGKSNRKRPGPNSPTPLPV